MREIKYPKTKMPEGFDQQKITPSKGNYYVVNSQGAAMKGLESPREAAIWRDHFFYGYYRDCKIMYYDKRG